MNDEVHPELIDVAHWDAVPKITHIPVAYRETNLGDDIQSFAASRCLECDRFVDRDSPQYWPADAVIPLIGWFGYGEFPARSQCIVVGLHIQMASREHMSSPRVVDWLKAGVKFQGFPAMARDLSTRDFLRELGIEAEFGGCITRTLPPRRVERRGTLIIDVDDESLEGCRDTHDRPHLPALTPAARLAEARTQLERLAHTELVHTMRLHVLLPCRAMGTEVIFHRPEDLFQPERFSGHLEL